MLTSEALRNVEIVAKIGENQPRSDQPASDLELSYKQLRRFKKPLWTLIVDRREWDWQRSMKVKNSILCSDEPINQSSQPQKGQDKE